MGGPTICPACDCGIDPKVAKLQRENDALRAHQDKLTQRLEGRGEEIEALKQQLAQVREERNEHLAAERRLEAFVATTRAQLAEHDKTIEEWVSSYNAMRDERDYLSRYKTGVDAKFAQMTTERDEAIKERKRSAEKWMDDLLAVQQQLASAQARIKELEAKP